MDCILTNDTSESTTVYSQKSILTELSEMDSLECSSDLQLSRKHSRKAEDRFIPIRNNQTLSMGMILQEKENMDQNIPKSVPTVPKSKDEVCKNRKRLLKFSSQVCEKKEEGPVTNEFSHELALKGLLKTGKTEKKFTKTPKKAEKVLDAPGLVNDYYLNLIDWGKKGLLAVCLGEGAFVWNPSTQEGKQFFNSETSLMMPTSVAWSAVNDNLIALGFNNSQVQVQDFEKGTVVREMFDHWSRVSSISWNPNFGHVVSTGSKDCEILSYDLRNPRAISQFSGHTQEVCGLKWNTDGSLLASGGNDNCLNIWDPRKPEMPLFQFKEHKAAVKALAWCPWQKNLIASGGGSEDKSIKFWKADEGKLVSSYKQNSQVCSLLWNPVERELLSAHGYSQFQLSLWRYPNMELVGEYFGHRDRVLHVALSPDNSTVVSAGADETLRFWKIFDGNKDLYTTPCTKSILAPLNIR